MKRGLGWIGVIIILLGGAFGGGWLSRREEVARLRDEASRAKQAEEQARTLLLRQTVSHELCRASAEAGQSNFGHAVERLEAAKKAAQAVDDLRPLTPRLDDAIASGRKVEGETHDRIERILHDLKP